MGTKGRHSIERLAAGRCSRDLEALVPHRSRDQIGDVRLVVDDEYAVALFHLSIVLGITEKSLRIAANCPEVPEISPAAVSAPLCVVLDRAQLTCGQTLLMRPCCSGESAARR